MTQAFFHRSLSLGLATVLTLVMLGSINQLSQPEVPVPQWAQQTQIQA
jgi:hypothetical protein